MQFTRCVWKDYGMIYECIVQMYVEDLIIPIGNEEEWMNWLRNELQVEAQNGMKIKWSRQFLQKSTE